MADQATELVQLIAHAGAVEVEAISARIATLMAEIEDFATSRKAEIASLKLIRRFLQRKLVPPAVQSSQQKLGKRKYTLRGGTQLQKEIYDLLAKEGSMPAPAIAARLQRTPHAISSCVGMCDWFHRENGEVHIAQKQETA